MTPMYAGIPASRRRELPPSLPVWSGECDQCQAAIICHAPSLKRHRKRFNELLVVCPQCADRQLSEHGGIEVMQFTAEVGRQFVRG